LDASGPLDSFVFAAFLRKTSTFSHAPLEGADRAYSQSDHMGSPGLERIRLRDEKAHGGRQGKGGSAQTCPARAKS